MSASALAKKPIVKVTLLNGKTPGQSYAFDKAVVTIGRSVENDISFAQDSKMSRSHVELHLDGSHVLIRNISQKNQILVNGEKVTEKAIVHSAVLHVGDQSIEIQPISAVPSAAASPAVAAGVGAVSSKAAPSKLGVAKPILVPPPPAAPSSPLVPIPDSRSRSHLTSVSPYKENEFKISPPKAAPMTRPNTSISGEGSSRIRFYAIIAIVVLALVWLLSDEGTKKNRDVAVRTEGDIVKAVEDSVKMVQEIQTNQRKTGQDSLQFKAAQENYIKGFRDYRQGQYARAMQSFQAALSLFPNHDLALKYYNRAKTKLQSQIDESMKLGRSYYQKHNYRMCQSSFASAMIMIKDTNDIKYKEARQFYNECGLRLEGRF